MPQAPLPANVLPTTRSLWPPAIDMPVPTSPGALGEVGVAPLLLLTIRLLSSSQQMFLRCAPGGGLGLVLPPGQSPSCGEGASSLFWLWVAKPSSLLLNSEFSTIRCPPEFEPE